MDWTLHLEPIYKVHYKQSDDKESKIRCHAKVEEDDDERKTEDWKYILNISPPFESHNTEIIYMLPYLQIMWD